MFYTFGSISDQKNYHSVVRHYASSNLIVFFSKEFEMTVVYSVFGNANKSSNRCFPKVLGMTDVGRAFDNENVIE